MGAPTSPANWPKLQWVGATGSVLPGRINDSYSASSRLAQTLHLLPGFASKSSALVRRFVLSSLESGFALLQKSRQCFFVIRSMVNQRLIGR